MNNTGNEATFNKNTLIVEKEIFTKPNKLKKAPSNKYNSFNSDCKPEDISGYPTPSYFSGF
jgi:hypothetical protein